MMFKKNSPVLLSYIALSAAVALSYFPAIASSPKTPKTPRTQQAVPGSATPKTPSASPATPTPRIVQPITANDCVRLQAGMTRVLKLKVSRTTTQFADNITPAQGTACQLTVSTTGSNFATIADIATPLYRLLSRQGWVADNRYAANGPEGAIAGFRKANSLAILNIQSSLSGNVICPDNVPIATCYQQAQPEEILYRITVQAAREN